MKDPLQPEETPYEILGLSRGASDREVVAAAKTAVAAVASGLASLNDVTRARKALQNPAERLVVDMLSYDPQVLQRLRPSPLEDASLLEEARRGATGQAWEAQFRREFPSWELAHPLALLCYWWVLRRETNLESSVAAEGSAVEAVLQLWTRVIAYWCMALATPELWHRYAGRDSQLAGRVRDAIMGRIRARLEARAHASRAQDDVALAGRYDDLSVALEIELRAAQALRRSGIKLAERLVGCGPIMLNLCGLSQRIGDAIAALPAEARSQEADLRFLRSALSPQASVEALLAENKPGQALTTIEGLPAAERVAPEVGRLRLRAFVMLGCDAAERGDVTEALDRWSEALEEVRARKLEVPEDLPEMIATAVRARAVRLRERRPDAAISVLDRALRLTENRDLQLMLADLLTQRGAQKFNQGRKAAESGESAGAGASMRSGLNDLERADGLGLASASTQLRSARKSLEQLTDPDTLPAGVAPLILQARQAGDREDWTQATRLLQQALALARSVPMSRQDGALFSPAQSLARLLGQLADAKTQSATAMQAHSISSPEQIPQLLHSARVDLEEALVLDPRNVSLRAQLEKLDELRTRMSERFAEDGLDLAIAAPPLGTPELGRAPTGSPAAAPSAGQSAARRSLRALILSAALLSGGVAILAGWAGWHLLRNVEIDSLRAKVAASEPRLDVTTLQPYLGKEVVIALRDGRIRRGTLVSLSRDMLTLSRRIAAMGEQMTNSTDFTLSSLKSIRKATARDD